MIDSEYVGVGNETETKIKHLFCGIQLLDLFADTL
jgi:hypothetical protein